MTRRRVVIAAVGLGIPLIIPSVLPAQENDQVSESFTANVPKMWDDAAMATLEIPLADPASSPKHVAADYYYKVGVRPLYKSYPV